MKPRIELRSNYARWFGLIARHHENAIFDLKVRLAKPHITKEQALDIRDKINEHNKIATAAREDEARYLLTRCVCGDRVLSIR